MKNNSSLIGAGLLTAIASSLCCITPVLALISGTTGMASSFSWLEPLRPYLIGFTVLVLAFAWYQKLKPKLEITCQCEDEQTSFLQTKTFLGIVTVFAIVMTLFPYYSTAFYPEHKDVKTTLKKENILLIEVDIEGMTCTSCEEHITHSIYELNGISDAKTSYENGKAFVSYDSSLVSLERIKQAINNTGYSVKNIIKK